MSPSLLDRLKKFLCNKAETSDDIKGDIVDFLDRLKKLFGDSIYTEINEAETLDNIKEKIFQFIGKYKEKVKPILEEIYEKLPKESFMGSKEEFVNFCLYFVWFRGEDALYENPLAPTLFRKEYPKNFEFVLFNKALQNPFIKKFFLEDKGSFLGVKEGLNIEFWVLLRHFENPSRILDFTENLEIALYFLTSKTDKDGFLYIIFPRILNLQVSFGSFVGSIPEDKDNLNLKARIIFGYIPPFWNLYIRNFKQKILDKKSPFDIENFGFIRDIEEFFNIKLELRHVGQLFVSPISIFFYPIALLIQNQKATGILFGGFLNDENTYKNLMEFLIKQYSTEVSRVYLPALYDIKLSPLLIVKIDKSLKPKIKKWLEKKGLTKYFVYGLDPKYLKDEALHIIKNQNFNL